MDAHYGLLSWKPLRSRWKGYDAGSFGSAESIADMIDVEVYECPEIVESIIHYVRCVFHD